METMSCTNKLCLESVLKDFNLNMLEDGDGGERRSSCRHLLAAACGDPEIAFANSFRGPLKKCTNRRFFMLAMTHNFLNFPRGVEVE
jgi:hypothetical protein